MQYATAIPLLFSLFHCFCLFVLFKKAMFVIYYTYVINVAICMQAEY